MSERIKLEDLRPADGATHRSKRVGRGRSSGHGKTSTRGHNGEGQRAGRSSKQGFEGGQMPAFRRLPKLKGFKNFNALNVAEINIRDIEKLDVDTAHNSFHLNIAINYGGREELVHACQALVSEGKTNITEDDIAANLYTVNCPDPDLVVRTGGDVRISNFLLWQSAYAEYCFTDVLWPDLSEQDVDAAIATFYSRHRRFGGV